MGGFVLLAEASSPTGIFDPASPPADSIRNLSVLIFAITGFIFLVVEGVLLYSILRFRRKAGTGNEPPQVYGSMPIEIAWTVAPALIVLIIVLVVTRTLWEVNVEAPKPKVGEQHLFVTVVGRQWWWEYTYDHYNGEPLGVVTANELHIPTSEDKTERRVYLTLKSADVCHSFWVPRLAGKTDLIPGKENHMWFQVKKPDLFVGQCAEFCGTQHANMLLRVVAESPTEFKRWLDNEKKDAVTPKNVPEDAEVSDGRRTFLGQSCVNCHRVRGTSARGTYAPDLTHLMSRQTLASGMVPNTEENLRQWVTDPQQIKAGCLMPAFGLSRRDGDLVVRYLLSLK